MEEAIERNGKVLLEADNSHFHESKSKPFQEETLPSSSTLSSMSSFSFSNSFSSSSTFSSSDSARKELMDLFDKIQREVNF